MNTTDEYALDSRLFEANNEAVCLLMNIEIEM